MGAQPAYDPPREVSGDLDHREDASLGVGHRNHIALVVLARVVAKRGAELARRVLDHRDFAADRGAIDVNVERRHEDRHAMVELAGSAGKRHLGDVGDFAVSAGNHDIFGFGGEAIRIAKEERYWQRDQDNDRADDLQPEHDEDDSGSGQS